MFHCHCAVLCVIPIRNNSANEWKLWRWKNKNRRSSCTLFSYFHLKQKDTDNQSTDRLGLKSIKINWNYYSPINEWLICHVYRLRNEFEMTAVESVGGDGKSLAFVCVRARACSKSVSIKSLISIRWTLPFKEESNEIDHKPHAAYWYIYILCLLSPPPTATALLPLSLNYLLVTIYWHICVIYRHEN